MIVRNFMNYLPYVEHGVEYLQFYLWFRDYLDRSEAAGPVEACLAPEWTQAIEDGAVAKIRPDTQVAEIFKGSDFEKQPGVASPHPFTTDGNESTNVPSLWPAGQDGQASTCASSTVVPLTTTPTYNSQVADAFHAAGAKLPCEYSFLDWDTYGD